MKKDLRKSMCRMQLFLAPVLCAMIGATTGNAQDPTGANSRNSNATEPEKVTVVQTSFDPFIEAGFNHETEVETMGAAFGDTIVQVAQVARNISSGGAESIGWATSTDGGSTWKFDFFQGITTVGGGPFARASDPVVAYDARHGTWITTVLAIPGGVIVAMLSPDGLNWSGPVTIFQAGPGESADKNWIGCDNFPDSPFFGNCYVEWDDPRSSQLIWMSTSTDGGQTWSTQVNTDGRDRGIGGVPVALPDGTALVPIRISGTVSVFKSIDGGATWSAAQRVAGITAHAPGGGLRTANLPSATVDGGGQVFVTWQDCSFRSGCSANDAVFVSSTDGETWSSVTRIPIDPIDSGIDHFEPAIAADPATSGGSAHLGVTYYFYPEAGCSASTCQLLAGFISSTDGGATWGGPRTLAGPMSLDWLAVTAGRRFAGDYFGTAVSNGHFFPLFIAANVPDSDGTLHEFMATTTSLVP